MEQKVKDIISVMSPEERLELFMEIYGAGTMDPEEMRSTAGLDESEYGKQMAEARAEMMDYYFDELPIGVLVDEYNRMRIEDKEL